MKTFLVKNLIVVFALLLGIGTMSFKMVERNNVTEYWFEVTGGSTVTENPADPSCNEDEGIVCAVAFDQPSVPEGVGDIDQARTHGAYRGERKKQP